MENWFDSGAWMDVKGLIMRNLCFTGAEYSQKLIIDLTWYDTMLELYCDVQHKFVATELEDKWTVPSA